MNKELAIEIIRRMEGHRIHIKDMMTVQEMKCYTKGYVDCLDAMEDIVAQVLEATEIFECREELEYGVVKSK